MPRKAALRASPAIDEPNIIIPLASSYNERGVAGYTHAVTNSEDQRKINCFYELAKNAATGKGTLTLAKRPGVTVFTDTYGTSTQLSYLALSLEFTPFAPTTHLYTIFNSLAGNIRSSTSAFNVTILASAGVYFPRHVDSTLISNVRNIVVQLYRYD